MGLWILGEQMLAVETLVELPVGRQQSCTHQWDVRPPLKAPSMTVDAILHDVPCVYQSVFANLPEDDVALAGGSDAVVVVDLQQSLQADVETLCHIACEPLPEDAVWRMAALYELRGQWLEGRQRARLAVAVGVDRRLGCPLVVSVVFTGFVVVSARVLVVALAHAVCHIAETVACIDVAHQALFLSAVRTGQLHGLVARQPL